ncbi:MAG: hypothetical protein KDB18_10750, partial [Salinibacterium sp.]|nr:hypothetical protein [Salinibacterium sp.]
DHDRIVRNCNARSAELFLKGSPPDAIGKSLSELFGPKWAEERHKVLDRVHLTGKPAIIRHIRHGRQIQSTIHLLCEPGEDKANFLVLTVAGEHDPEDPERFEIVESELAHLGPLDALSKRELEVLALIGHGMSTSAIAEALHRSPRTIERHCDSLRAKLNTTSRIKLAKFAHRAGLRLEDAERERLQ